MSLIDLQAEAARLGFGLFGITRPIQPAHWKEYTAWLKAGRHATMTYLSSERGIQMRAQPEQILENCRSVIVLGLPYHPDIPGLPQENKHLTGRIASYAWGEDYHQVILALLGEMATRITQQFPNSNYRIYTDTGPILERDLAQIAGLGWIGKNTCLIAPGVGSFFFLAEIFTTLDLPATSPFTEDRCGTCQRCIQACPTNCILPDRTLDARRCISYLTIENKGAILTELRPHMSNWIFGCDICQMVCPWNQRFAHADYIPAFSPRPGIAQPDLLEEILLTPLEFNRKFNNSPVLRARRSGYLRNVAVALGNSGDRRAIPILQTALAKETDSMIHEHIQWALDQLR
jgi:epoxyqueuosine reductase